MKLSRAAPLLAALLTAALYASTLGGTLVYDDVAVLRDDPRIRSIETFPKLWTRDYYNGTTVQINYRPLTSSTYAIQYLLHGERAWAFHLVNIVLAMLVSAMVAALGVRLFGNGAGLIAGLLFAAHPVHVEAIANIVGRAELLCAIGTIGALLVVIDRQMTRARAGATFLLFLLALLSKEQGMAIPMLLLIAFLLLRRKPDASADPEPEKEAWQLVAIGASMGLAGYISLREQILRLRFWWDRAAMDWTVNPMVPLVVSERLLMAITVAGHYFKLLVFPRYLSPDYSGNAIGFRWSMEDPHFYLGLFAIALWLLAGILAITYRHRGVLFCLLALAVVYGMIGNVVELIGTIFGERLIYLPSAFFVLIIAAGIVRLPKPVAWVLVLALLGLGAVRTYTYAKRWNDPVALFAGAIETHPDAIRNYLSLGAELRDRGRLAESRAVLEAGCERLPSYFETRRFLARTLIDMGEFDAAAEQIRRVREFEPGLTVGLDQLLEERRGATQPVR